MAKDAAQRAKKNTVKDNSVKNGKPAKPNKFKLFFKKIADGFRRLRSELKKVSWPTFKGVMKQTTVVLVVTLFFLVIIGGIDAGFNALFKLLISK